jgi:hypothetical protein
MKIKDYNWITSELPEVNYDNIIEHYKEAMQNEGSTNEVLSLNWNDLDVFFSLVHPLSYIVQIEITDCGVKTKELGWEELGLVVLGFDINKKQWSLLI